MSWSERQHGLLQAMGLRLWSPPVRSGAVAVAVAAPAQAPALPVNVPVNQRVMPSVRSPIAPKPYAPAPKTEINTAATANLDWPALRSAVAECRACGLCESRSQTVFGVGHPQAHWLVVGEAPGEEEDLSGEPFVGRSGQLLDSMLAALRLSRADGTHADADADADATPARRVYIANALKCRPPRNRNPTPAEMAQCEPFLLRQIQLLQPRVILAMGRLAVDVLLPSHDAIGKLRGRVHRYQGVPVVVTFDLVYLLRNLHEKARAWEDLCLAAEVAERAVVVTP